MREIKIVSYGISMPKNILKFGTQTRYRISEGETQLTMASEACKKALESKGMDIKDIDCIVSATSVGSQPIPCTAALIHEIIAKGTEIPALDINTTCTSFITALDIMSYLINGGRYNRVLIVSSEVPSLALNREQQESFELFSDGAVAIIIEKSTEKDTGILYSEQKTWSEGAHTTEIRGGLANYHPNNYSETNKKEYMFDMKGKAILSIVLKYLPKMVNEFFEKNSLTIDDIDMVIPHQASPAMPLLMKKLGIPNTKFINTVSEYGNMVAASVPFTLCKALEEKKIKKGDRLLLMGTAAGLTTNLLYMKI